MQLLYHEDHFNALKRQISKRQLLLLLLALAVLAAVSATLILDDHKENRPVLLTTLLLIFGGGMLIFLWDMTDSVLFHSFECFRSKIRLIHPHQFEQIREP